jgi:hypothetical protein
MPRKSQDHVHRLVRSMSPAEKRYYKLHLARHGSEGASNQELLFDAIASMDEYDERALLDRFKQEAFTHRFAITKRRLYEGILRSLDSFHTDSSVDVRLHRSLHHVELLHQRALYDDAAKVLLGVRRSAELHERPAILIAVAEWERRLIECRNYTGIDQAALDRIIMADEKVRQQQTQLDTLWGLKSNVFLHLYQYGQARDPKAWERSKELLEHPILRDPQQLTTAKAKFLFHHLKGAAAFAMGDTSTCHEHLTSNLGLLTTERDRFVDEPNLVLGVVSNLIYVCIQAGRYTEAFAHLKSFRTLPAQWNMPESDDLDLKLFSTTTSLELSMYMRMGDLEHALELVPVVERGLAQHAGLISPVRKAGFQYQLAYAHFAAGHPEIALRWINALLNDMRTDDQSDPACFGRLLHLLILLEMGKLDVLPYTLRNTERFLRLRSRKHRFEPLLLQLVRGLLKKQPEEVRRSVIETFLLGVAQLEGDPFERPVFDHFDPIAWAESKLRGEPFARRLKARALEFARAA